MPLLIGSFLLRYSVDENVMWSPKSREKLRAFSLVAQNHKSTSGYSDWLKRFDLRPVLSDWLKLSLPRPPIGSLSVFRENVQFVLDHYDQF